MRKPTWGPRKPRLDHDLLEQPAVDLLQTNEDGWIPVEMRGREEHGRLVGEQRLLGDEMLHPCAKDRPSGAASPSARRSD